MFGQGIDDIVGIVYSKDLMRAEREGRHEDPVSTIMREAQFTPESKKVSELMREMQAGKYHLAIVVDEFGGTAGLVTLEDLIEELVGEITDEYDVEEVPSERLDDGTVVVNARMPVDEVNELLEESELPEGDEWDTVGGLLYSLLGHVPVEGEAAFVDGHRLVAERVQGRRIGRVRISPLESATAPSRAALAVVSRRTVRSGFAALVGRPNVGKSTLLNTILGEKVSITSPVAQTTRMPVRGVLNRPDAQVVFVDTPGIHKPRTLLGERLNDTAAVALRRRRRDPPRRGCDRAPGKR